MKRHLKITLKWNIKWNQSYYITNNVEFASSGFGRKTQSECLRTAWNLPVSNFKYIYWAIHIHTTGSVPSKHTIITRWFKSVRRVCSLFRFQKHILTKKPLPRATKNSSFTTLRTVTQVILKSQKEKH